MTFSLKDLMTNKETIIHKKQGIELYQPIHEMFEKFRVLTNNMNHFGEQVSVYSYEIEKSEFSEEEYIEIGDFLKQAKELVEKIKAFRSSGDFETLKFIQDQINSLSQGKADLIEEFVKLSKEFIGSVDYIKENYDSISFEDEEGDDDGEPRVILGRDFKKMLKGKTITDLSGSIFNVKDKNGVVQEVMKLKINTKGKIRPPISRISANTEIILDKFEYKK